MSPGPDFRGADRERCVSYFTLLWWSKNALSAMAGRRKRPVRCVGCSGDLLPPSPPAEQAAINKPATIARIMAGGPPFYCPVLGKDRRRGNDRLGAGDYHGSRRRLRHSISAVRTETPSTKRRPLGPFSPADKINAERNVNPELRRPTPAAAGHEVQLTPDRKAALDHARLLWLIQ
jgi:hypothetical protein